MIADFVIVGNVGKITQKRSDRGIIYTTVSVVINDYYKGKRFTQWINTVQFFGTLGTLVLDNTSIGNTIFVSGKIKVFKVNKRENVFFVGEKFRIIGKTDMQYELARQEDKEKTGIDAEDILNQVDDNPYDLGF